jgi:hypothetical protein
MSPPPLRVVVAGAEIAGLEALVALRTLAGHAVEQRARRQRHALPALGGRRLRDLQPVPVVAADQGGVAMADAVAGHPRLQGIAAGGRRVTKEGAR